MIILCLVLITIFNLYHVYRTHKNGYFYIDEVTKRKIPISKKFPWWMYVIGIFLCIPPFGIIIFVIILYDWSKGKLYE